MLTGLSGSPPVHIRSPLRKTGSTCNVPLKVIVISLVIAFVAYCSQVPANRVGHYEFSAAQLKTIQGKMKGRESLD